MTDTLRLERFLPYRLSVTSNRVSALIGEAYDRLFGLTIPQWRVVAVLAEAAPSSQLAIMRRTRMDKMTVSRAVRPLVDRGLVARSANDGDGRSRLLALTVAGRDLHARIAPQALAIEADLLADFTAAEIAAIAHALERLDARAAALSRAE